MRTSLLFVATAINVACGPPEGFGETCDTADAASCPESMDCVDKGSSFGNVCSLQCDIGDDCPAGTCFPLGGRKYLCGNDGYCVTHGSCR